MEQAELEKYICQALNTLQNTTYGQTILENARGRFFNISAENIHIIQDKRRAGRCYREISPDNTAKDKITLNTNVLKRDKERPLITEEDRIKGLACILAHELTHARQYNANPDIIPINDLRQKAPCSRYVSYSAWIREISQDCIMEADARTACFMMMQLLDASPYLRKQMKNTEQNPFYMTEQQFKNLSLFHAHPLSRSPALCQKIARDSFKAILETSALTISEYREKSLQKRGKDINKLKKQNKISVNYNFQESLAAIKAVYDPNIYGDPSLFLDTIPGLSSENRIALMKELSETSFHKQPEKAPNTGPLPAAVFTGKNWEKD